MPDNVRKNLLKCINDNVGFCRKCVLHQSTGLRVFGEGNPNAKLIFCGEASGATEAQTGRPFVGRAGKLLDVMIEKMGMKREDVYILNTIKCHPPNNRVPEPEEIEACMPYLIMQLKVIEPKVVVTLGSTATTDLLGPGEGITKRRGGIYHIDVDDKEITVVPTLHPAACLRNPSYKKLVAEDLSLVLKLLKNEFGTNKRTI